MLTEYKGNIYRAQIEGKSIHIWKYVPVENFDKCITKSGITYYEKFVNMDEVSSFFFVAFEVFYDEKTFRIASFDNDFLAIICNDELYSKRNNFTKIERGVWITKKPIISFNEISMITRFVDSEEKIIEQLSIDVFKQKWKCYVKDVSI